MSSINKVILIGNLGQDPQVINPQVVRLSVATSERYKNKDGSYSDKTEWHKVVCFNEYINKSLSAHAKKGMRVYVDGKLVTNKYMDEYNNEKLSVEIQISTFKGEVVILSPRGNEQPVEYKTHHVPAFSQPDYKFKEPGVKSMKDLLDNQFDR